MCRVFSLSLPAPEGHMVGLLLSERFSRAPKASPLSNHSEGVRRWRPYVLLSPFLDLHFLTTRLISRATRSGGSPPLLAAPTNWFILPPQLQKHKLKFVRLARWPLYYL